LRFAFAVQHVNAGCLFKALAPGIPPARFCFQGSRLGSLSHSITLVTGSSLAFTAERSASLRSNQALQPTAQTALFFYVQPS
jgi:hypothetical protein